MQQAIQISKKEKNFRKFGLVIIAIYTVLFVSLLFKNAHAALTSKLEVSEAKYLDIQAKQNAISTKVYADEFNSTVTAAIKDGKLSNKEYNLLNSYYLALIKHDMGQSD